MTKWLLVRHGETEWNAAGRAQGQADLPLSERGRLQASRLAERLAGERFSKAYASDLLRAAETARTILGASAAILQTRADLREQRYGIWEGMTYTEIRQRHGGGYARMKEGDIGFAPPGGGESASGLMERVGAALARMQKDCSPDDTVLVVGHTGSLCAAAVRLLGLPPARFWSLTLSVASVSLIHTSLKAAPSLENWDDVGHLTANGQDGRPVSDSSG